ncbi:MAG: hypothetical protein U1E77_12060 [Inhella sp.]
MKLALLLSLAALLPLSTLAATPCQRSLSANPNIVIPVYVNAQREVSNHPQYLGGSFTSYRVSLGANNEFDQLCITHRNAVMLFTLLNQSQYEFIDIRFYENGLPSAQILQTEVQGNYVRVINKNDSATRLKYVVILRDRSTGAVISKDPLIVNEPD